MQIVVGVDFTLTGEEQFPESPLNGLLHQGAIIVALYVCSDTTSN